MKKSAKSRRARTMSVPALALGILAAVMWSSGPVGSGPGVVWAQAGGAVVGEANVVNVTLSDSKIDMPTVLPPGPTVFVVKNAGDAAHNFRIEGQGLNRQFDFDLPPGQSNALAVDVAPGTYRAECPIPGRAHEGMAVQLSVLTLAAAQAQGLAGPVEPASVLAPGPAPAGAAEGAESEGAAAEPDPGEQPDAVEVKLEDFKIDMPVELPAGPTTFHVTNAGQTVHNFQIIGQGINRAFDANLAPGQSNTMDVDLTPGAYRVTCPVDGHAEMGMETQVTVK